MALPVLIIGRSGSGKSTSLRNFAPEEIAIINVEGKPMPFKRSQEGIVHTDNYETIKGLLRKTQKKAIAIDDAGYLITNFFMRNHSKAGNLFDMYNQMGDDFWTLIHFIKNRLPQDAIVYIMMHENVDEFNGLRPKTIGKLLDEKVCIEGMFTIVLRAIITDDKYQFAVHNSGGGIVKTPLGMFEEDYIDNDLKLVDGVIRNYYDLSPLVTSATATEHDNATQDNVVQDQTNSNSNN